MGLHVGEDAISNTDWDLDPLVRIDQMRAARNFLDWKIEEAVIEARTKQRAKAIKYDLVGSETRQDVLFGLATWQEIAAALGVTRQAAYRKYGWRVRDASA